MEVMRNLAENAAEWSETVPPLILFCFFFAGNAIVWDKYVTEANILLKEATKKIGTFF